MNEVQPPFWLLAELTYRCPLQCPYCSNPLDMASVGEELDTETWFRVMRQARELGAAQLGFSGGEPVLRPDLAELVGEARRLGYYTNLITSGVGLTRAKVAEYRRAGLDHIQISFQASSEELNNWFAGSPKAFARKVEAARAVKAQGYPMVLNVVLHRHNIEQVEQILQLASELDADYVELANTQYYGWALHNRQHLLPSRAQVERAESVVAEFRRTHGGRMKVIFVVPDYYETRPKACMNGWGSIFLTITPDGTALPCHSARELPVEFPRVQDTDIATIWYDSAGFNAFRGDEWMKEPCLSCPEKHKDFGGCRCQAFQLTGDAAAADPVCDKSRYHHKIAEAIAGAGAVPEEPIVFRNMNNARRLSGQGGRKL